MKHLFTTILFCFFTFITKAQKINPYLLTNNQADSLHAVQVQTTNDSLRMEIDAIFSMYYSENDKDSAIYFLNRQLKLATRLNLPLWKAEALSYLGIVNYNSNNYSKSLQVLTTCQEIIVDKASEKNGYPPKFIVGIPEWFTNRECLLSVVYFNAAILDESVGNQEKARQGYAKAIHMAEKSGDTSSLATYHWRLGMSYAIRNKSDSAFTEEQKALTLSRRAKWQYYTSDIYRSIGALYRDADSMSVALRYLQQSVTISHQQQNLEYEALAYRSLSRYFLKENQPDSAIYYLKKMQVISSKIKDKELEGDAYFYLSSAYQTKGNMDSAYHYLRLSKNMRDSLAGAVAEQMRQYQVLSYNEQLRRQEADSERSREQARMITYLMLAGLGITSLILFLLYRNNRQRHKTNKALTTVRDLQDKKISQLDEAVTKRTEQLNSFRQVMATDFHDQTGNMLSAISRQAMMLKLKLNGSGTEVLPMVESIITNSNELYDSSKDFLWNLNHNSDDPLEVFQYLVNYGQVYYNQFNIPFSSSIKGEVQALQQLDSFAALNLIYIFKEAMTNVVKHAGASEVVFEMEYSDSKVMYALQDNGTWKPKDDATSHYGLTNMERRCEKNKFGFLLSRQSEGTRIEIAVPVTIDFIS